MIFSEKHLPTYPAGFGRLFTHMICPAGLLFFVLALNNITGTRILCAFTHMPHLVSLLSGQIVEEGAAAAAVLESQHWSQAKQEALTEAAALCRAALDLAAAAQASSTCTYNFIDPSPVLASGAYFLSSTGNDPRLHPVIPWLGRHPCVARRAPARQPARVHWSQRVARLARARLSAATSANSTYDPMLAPATNAALQAMSVMCGLHVDRVFKCNAAGRVPYAGCMCWHSIVMSRFQREGPSTLGLLVLGSLKNAWKPMGVVRMLRHLGLDILHAVKPTYQAIFLPVSSPHRSECLCIGQMDVLVVGSRGLKGVQRAMLPLLGLGSVSDYCGARPPRRQDLSLLLGPVSILERSIALCCARHLFSLLRCAYGPYTLIRPPVPCMPVQQVSPALSGPYTPCAALAPMLSDAK